MKTKSRQSTRFTSRLQAFAVSCLASLLAIPVGAAQQIPDVPLQAGARVAPNIMFVLDDSGSMSQLRMPADAFSLLADSIADRSFHHNTLYYNPGVTYRPWRTGNGDERMAGGASYNAVYPWFDTVGGATIDLGNPDSCVYDQMYQSNRKPRELRVCGGEQTFYVLKNSASTPNSNDRRLYWRYVIPVSGQITRCEATSANGAWGSCVAALPPSRGDGSNTDSDEQRNYATWYSYYRTRMKSAKGGAAEAFADLDENNRVGFTGIWGNYQDTYSATSNVAEWTLDAQTEFYIPVGRNGGLFSNTTGANNRADWFQKLFETRGRIFGGTPLKLATDRVGKYYKGELTGIADPYGPEAEPLTCRQNFAILTTDGYYNADNHTPPRVGEHDNVDGTILDPRTSAPVYRAGPPYASSYSDTLADIAMKYWKEDLRPDMVNNVPTTANNPAFWQHMSTFAISIGLSGELNPATDWTALQAGTKQWPEPKNGQRTAIDDLWHAAVNGRGEFVVANNPTAFAEALDDALAAIATATASRSSVSASSASLSTSTGIFQANYDTANWSGDLVVYRYVEQLVNGVLRKVLQATPAWSASAQMPVWTSRNVRTEGDDASTATFPTAAQEAALGSQIANYLKGDKSNEGATFGKLRPRTGVIGDIVHSPAVFVEGVVAPDATDVDDTVYVGSNGGMLHAFDARTGAERFAYVPGGIDLVNLRSYSQAPYAHKWFVDGPIVVSDRQQTPDRNILVGALGRGGKGLYALDVTDPNAFGSGATPGRNRVLWDQTWTTDVATSSWSSAADDVRDMGKVLGAPILHRTNDGKFSVIVANGVDSESGVAALYVIDAETGSITRRISIPNATGVTNNGLMNIRGLDVDGNGTLDVVYGGDLQGNIWKFGLGGASSGWEVAYKLIQSVKDGVPQPITGGLSIAYDPATYLPYVVFGTGSLLYEADLNSRAVQSMYGVIDGGDTVARGDLQERYIEVEEGSRRAFELPSRLQAGKKGWVVDLVGPDGRRDGERITTDVQVVAGQVRMASQIPSGNACQALGSGWIYLFDAFTGSSTVNPGLDADGDGEFEDEKIGEPPRSTGGVRQEEGMPGNLIDLGPELVYGHTGAGRTRVGVATGEIVGRISWKEIFSD